MLFFVIYLFLNLFESHFLLKINTADKFEVFNYSAKDILISRDIAFINSKLHPEEYQERIKSLYILLNKYLTRNK